MTLYKIHGSAALVAYSDPVVSATEIAPPVYAE